ncbi:MAG: HD domain-containing phosphohydrolase [Bdellovibrionia bacterium]
MKIMVLLQPAEIRDLIVFNLETKLKVEIIEPSSEAEAIGLLFTNSDLDLIIIDGNQKWTEFLKVAKEKIKDVVTVCILSPEKEQLADLQGLKVIDTLPKSKLLERLPIILQEYFSQKEGIDNQKLKDSPLYCRIATTILLRYSPLKADIYVRLSEDKFVKLFLKGDVFDKEDLEKYLVQKKLKYLHILNEHVGEFSEKVEQDLLSVLNTEGATAQDLQKAAITGVDVIGELREKLGLTPAVQTLIKTTCKLMVKSASAHPKLKDLFINLAMNSKQYNAVHSTTLSQISCSIAAAMDWNSESTFQKLAMASILHDITLTNSFIAEIRTLEELSTRSKEFSETDMQKYLVHPIEASDLTLLLPEMLPDVDTIILQHHELPDGSGFPRKLAGARISPLAALFIVAHDLVYSAMHSAGSLTIKDFVDSRREKYSSGNFKKALAALDKLKE